VTFFFTFFYTFETFFFSGKTTGGMFLTRFEIAVKVAAGAFLGTSINFLASIYFTFFGFKRSYN
jgi:hypothetical protein